MFISYKYRLYPSREQETSLDLWSNHMRWLWNHYLDANIQRYKTEHKFIYFMDMSIGLPKLKKEHEWLKVVPSHALLSQCQRLEKAIKASTSKNKYLGFPKFKCKGRDFCSTRIDQINDHIKLFDNYIQIPKLGKVKWKYHRPIPGKLKSITISKDKTNKWYVSVLCETADVVPISLIDNNKVIGIDLGVSSFATLSNGDKIASQNFLKKQLRKLKYQQRFLKNKTKGSNNTKKQYRRIARIHLKIRNQRSNYLHHLSNSLTNKYDVICVEDLNIKELLMKKQLSRSIADQGWGIFVNQLEYKSNIKGKHFTKIDTYLPSTKTCSCCGHTRKMKLSDRVYECINPSCTDYLKTKDRDHNAAINIQIWGLMATDNIQLYTPGIGEIKACGDTQSCLVNITNDVSVKQEASRP